MDFSFTDDQIMLRDSVSRYLERHYDLRARDALLRDGGFSAKQWSSFADLGLLAAPFPEEVGGLGGGAVSVLVIMEEFGRQLVLEPFLWTVVIGGQLLLGDEDSARRESRIAAIVDGSTQIALAATADDDRGWDPRYLAGGVSRDGTGYRLSANRPVVANGAIADQFVVAARTAGAVGEDRGITLFVVPRETPGVSVSPYRLHDGTNAASVTFDNVALGADSVLGTPDDGLTLLEGAYDHGRAALCSEAVGSATYLVRSTADYLKLRVQYGQPIARFQVVQHRLADMYMAAELARSMSYVAALAVDRNDGERARDVAAAKAHINRHARYVGNQAVQLHGGMGMSEELDVAHRFKRLTMISRTLSDEAEALARFADLANAA